VFLENTQNVHSDGQLLRVEHLRVVFARDGREVPVVEDVSFSIERGQALGLVGESGSGKTLSALAVVRLLPPPARIAGGEIEFDGRDLLAATPRDLQQIRGCQIGFVFQEPAAALNPVYTIGFQLRETLAVHGIARGRAARHRAIELLALAGIGDPTRRALEYPHQLSGGLKQRAMIALAIAAEPTLLIADEPTTALDATLQAELIELLRRMRNDLKLSLLLITHDLAAVATLVDRVAVMNAGRIVEEAPTETLFRAPVHPYTRHLVECCSS
jgi:ABC-type dipeptide/oligopeptide/nickel transport system ATPase component